MAAAVGDMGDITCDSGVFFDSFVTSVLDSVYTEPSSLHGKNKFCMLLI